ncbi:hypothetical protein YC2023_061823 [Brassica napus]
MYNEANITDIIDRLGSIGDLSSTSDTLFFPVKGIHVYSGVIYFGVRVTPEIVPLLRTRLSFVGMTRYGFGSSEFESLVLTVDYGTCGTEEPVGVRAGYPVGVRAGCLVGVRAR